RQPRSARLRASRRVRDRSQAQPPHGLRERSPPLPGRPPRSPRDAARGGGVAAGGPRLRPRHRGAARARRRLDDDADAPSAGLGGDVVRLTVDGASCMGHGRCYQVAPDLLTFDDEGYVTIRDETIDVPADLLEAADEAGGTCPEQAIAL